MGNEQKSGESLPEALVGARAALRAASAHIVEGLDGIGQALEYTQDADVLNSIAEAMLQIEYGGHELARVEERIDDIVSRIVPVEDLAAFEKLLEDNDEQRG